MKPLFCNTIAAIAGFAISATAAVTPVDGPRSFANDDGFLEYLQQQHFQFFWNEANPANGLIRDRSTPTSACSIAGVGFGLSVINVAIERGWISREAGRQRVLTTLEAFMKLPQGSGTNGCSGYRGWFYHFLDMNTGLRTWNCELSTIDTSLLMMGVVDAGLFFDDRTNAEEARVRELSDALVKRVDWQFMLRTNDYQVSMEWRPEKGHSQLGWLGYSEASCMYLLGLGAESNALPPESWEAWTRGYAWTNYGGFEFAACPPLFTHQYSFMWIDFRKLRDRPMRDHQSTYFENSRRATQAQRHYAEANPLRFPNYSKDEWGLSACDGPGRVVDGVRFEGYSARGAPGGFDDGTLAPTVAISSMPFTPEESVAAAKHFYFGYGRKLWTNEGFRDAYNLKANWWGEDVIGIDQGPIVLMIENYRTGGSVWRRMMRSPVLRGGLERAGFTGLP